MVAEPVWSIRDSLFGTHTKIEVYSYTKDALANELRARESEIYNLQLKNFELTHTLTALSKQIEVETVQSQKNRITVKVLSKPPYTPFDLFVIKIGVENNVALGAPVYIGENTLIGKITKVVSRYSEVTLLSSGGSVSETRVLRTGESVSIQGSGGGMFVATLPKDFDILPGDVLVTGDTTQHIVTEVSSIDSSSQGSFKKVFARIPVNIFSFEWVGVEK